MHLLKNCISSMVLLSILIVSETTFAQSNPENCPEVTDQDPVWLDVNKGWIYDPALLINGDECRTNVQTGPYGWAKSQCTSWARFRTGFQGTNDGGKWAEPWNQCATPTGNDTNITCWSTTPSVGTLLIREPVSDGDTGHVAVVECVDGSATPQWVKVSEYNVQPCKFGYNTVDVSQGGYKFLYPDGKPVPLPTDCEAVPRVDSAIVSALNDQATNVSVAVYMRGTTCAGIVHDLVREVYNSNGLLEPLHTATSYNINVLAPYNDQIYGLPLCAEIRYTLKKKEGFIITSSETRLAHNLAAPTGFTVDKTQGYVTRYTFNWNMSCASIQGTKAKLSCQCGVQGESFSLYLTDAPYQRNLSPGAQYTCQLQTYNDGDVSFPATHTFITESNEVPVPAPPVIQNGSSCNQKLVTWTPVGNYVYELKIKRDDVDYASFSDVNGNSKQFTASLDGKYTFALRAYDRQDPARSSVLSNYSSYTVIDCLLEVPVLNELTTADCAGVTLSWAFPDGITPGAIFQFHIYRKVATSTEDYEKIDHVFSNANSYTDFSGEDGVNYSYKILVQYYQGGESALSNSQEKIAQSPPIPPRDFTTSSDSRNVLVKFTDQSDDETGFILERKVSNSDNYQIVQNLPSLAGKGISMLHTDPLLNVNTIYLYRVRAIRNNCFSNADSSPKSRAIILNVPGNFKITAQDNAIKLQWTPVTYATSYEIFKKRPSDNDWPTIASFEVTPIGTNTQYFTDNGGASFQYQIRAKRNETEVINLSAFAGPISLNATSNCESTAQPIAPNITSATTNEGTASVSWTDLSTDEDGFIIEYNPNNIGWRLYSEIASATPTSTGTLHRSVNLTNYLSLQVEIRIRAFRENGDGSRCYSNFSNVRKVNVLRPPTAVRATQHNSTNSVKIQWNYPSPPKFAHEFEVQFRNSTYAPWSTPELEYYTYTSSVHHHITLSMDYYYRVRAVTKSGEDVVAASAWSSMVSPLNLNLPKTPEGFVIAPMDEANRFNGDVKLLWIDRANNEDRYQVSIWKADATTNQFPDQIHGRININSDAATKPSTGSRVYDHDGNLRPGNYRFGIAAKNTLGVSDTIYSDYMIYGKPAKPTLAKPEIRCYVTGPAVQLTWTDDSRFALTETEFRIYRKEYFENNYTLIQTLPAGTTNYTDDGSAGYPLLPTKTYNYYVKAYSEIVNLDSEQSATKNVTIPIMAPLVTGVSATPKCAKLIIKWDIATEGDGYRVTIRRNGEFYQSFTTGNRNSSSYTATITQSGNYEAVVQAKSNCYFGEESAPVTTWVTTESATTPLDFTANGGCKTISAAWASVVGATQYRIQVWLDGSLKRSIYTTLQTTTISSLAPGYYTLRIGSINQCGISAEAETAVIVSATPAKPTINSISADCNVVNLAWSTSAYADFYQIYRKQQGFSEYTLLGKVFCAEIENTVTAGPNTIFYYQVDAGNACGISSRSASRSTLLFCTTAFADPKQVARVQSDDNEDQDVILPEVNQNIIAYPNPFDKSVTIRYYVKNTGNVKLTIYNAMGTPVANAIDGKYRKQGWHEAIISTEHFSNGIYIAIVQQEGDQRYSIKLDKH